MPSTAFIWQAAPAATTNTTLGTATADSSATVAIVNRSSSVITVRLAISATDSPTNAEWLEFGATIPANGVLERTGLVIPVGEKVVVFASTADTSVSVYGFAG
jgi:hypothetical protein